jgi:hypothetical protein
LGAPVADFIAGPAFPALYRFKVLLHGFGVRENASVTKLIGPFKGHIADASP